MEILYSEGHVEGMDGANSFKTLGPGIAKDDINAFVDIINSWWGSLFQLDYDTMRERLDSGHLFIGAYVDDEPMGILETLSIRLEGLPSDDENLEMYDVQQLAKMAAEALRDQYKYDGGYYNRLTNNGRWAGFEESSNTVLLVDINKRIDYKKSDVPIGIVELLKSLLAFEELRTVVAPLQGVQYVPSFTPSGQGIQKWHTERGALDSLVDFGGARPGYIFRDREAPNVHPMVYLTPNYKPEVKGVTVRAA